MATYYDVDLRHATLREFAFGTPWYSMPLVTLLKFAGFHFPCSTDDPPVEALAPFEVDEAALPDEVRARFQPLTEELRKLGFCSPIVHSIACPLQATRNYWASFLHPSGRAWARILCRIWSAERKDRVSLFPLFFTEFDDGSFLITSAGKPDMIMPVGTRMVNQVGADCPALWQRHETECEQAPATPRRIAGGDELRAAMERLHGRIRDYLLGRSIFRPLTEAEQRRLQDAHVPAGPGVLPMQDPPGPAAPAPPADAEAAAVLIELERLQNRQTSWATALLVLAVSLVLFLGTWRVGQGQELLWAILPILAFHELGHYLAMRWFGYRNLRMFFIPFLGAAVSGQHYNVPGWKKAVVALLGPVPGIVAGGALGLLGRATEQPALVDTALFMVILNGFNLLPLMPLDGGWVLHAVLFVRHPVLDVVFRGLAIVGLFGLALAVGDRVLWILPGFLLLSLPVAWQIACVAHRLRRQGGLGASPDAHRIPAETAHTILGELRAAQPRHRTPRMLAEQVVQVFETVNARPPGVLASLALLAVHAGCFLGALVLTGLLLLGPNWRAWNQQAGFPEPPAQVFERGQTALWRGADVPPPLTDSGLTLVATCPDADAAQRAFEALRQDLPPNAVLRWFGQDVLLVLPAEEKAARERWLQRFREVDAKAAMRDPGESFTVRVAFPLPEGAAGDALEAELRDYLTVPNCDLLIPPWAPEWTGLTAADRERCRKARQTLRRLYGLEGLAIDRVRVKVDLRRPGPFGNQDEWRERVQTLGQVIEAEKQRLLEEIRAEGDDTVDRPMLPLWEAFSRLKFTALPEKDEDGRLAAFWRERDELLRQMAERMGCLALQGDRPAPGVLLTAARHGHVMREERTLALFITFYHPHEGLPALAEWVARHGPGQLRYEFLKGESLDDEEDP